MHRVRYRLNVVLYLIAFVFANLLRFLPNDETYNIKSAPCATIPFITQEPSRKKRDGID